MSGNLLCYGEMPSSLRTRLIDTGRTGSRQQGNKPGHIDTIKRNMNNAAVVALGAVIPNLPFVAIAIVGLILSRTRRSRFPRGARWATVGFASLLLQAGISVLKEYTVAISIPEADPNNYIHGLVWMTSGIYLLHLMSLSALAMAVFAERVPGRTAAAT